MAFVFDSKYDENSHENTSTIEFFPDLQQFLQDESDLKPDGIQTEWALVKIGTLQSRLDILQSKKKKQGAFPDRFSTHVIINLANDVFGYDGWSSRIIDFEIKLEKEDSENPGFTAVGIAVIRVELTDGTFRDATGYGNAINLPKNMCYSNCRKQAITDASKNAILSFRELLLDYELKIKLESDSKIKSEVFLK